MTRKTMFEELLEGIDLTELKEMKGFSGYSFDLNLGRILSIPKRFTENELMQLKNDFKQLELKHRKVMDTYQELADKFKCSHHTVQVKYLEWRKANKGRSR